MTFIILYCFFSGSLWYCIYSAAIQNMPGVEEFLLLHENNKSVIRKMSAILIDPRYDPVVVLENIYFDQVARPNFSVAENGEFIVVLERAESDERYGNTSAVLVDGWLGELNRRVPIVN